MVEWDGLGVFFDGPLKKRSCSNKNYLDVDVAASREKCQDSLVGKMNIFGAKKDL